MRFEFAATLLVVTSCVYGQLTQDEVDQFTLAGGCTTDSGKIAPSLSVRLNNGVVTIQANHVPNHLWQVVSGLCIYIWLTIKSCHLSLSWLLIFTSE